MGNAAGRFNIVDLAGTTWKRKKNDSSTCVPAHLMAIQPSRASLPPSTPCLFRCVVVLELRRGHERTRECDQPLLNACSHKRLEGPPYSPRGVLSDPHCGTCATVHILTSVWLDILNGAQSEIGASQPGMWERGSPGGPLLSRRGPRLSITTW
jgi:hypothetical protein